MRNKIKFTFFIISTRFASFTRPMLNNFSVKHNTLKLLIIRNYTTISLQKLNTFDYNIFTHFTLDVLPRFGKSFLTQ